MSNSLELLPSAKYKVSAKNPNTGRFWQYASLSMGKFGNWQIGMKVTPELKALIDANDGGWVNFSLFDDEKRDTPPEAKEGIQKLNNLVDDDSMGIPF